MQIGSMDNQAKNTKILVTGAKGQLGSELKIISAYEPYQFVFVDIEELDLTDGTAVNAFFNTHKIDFCINCAAYTAVDYAEKNKEAARAVNVDAVQNLAEACTINNTFLFQISTDFVFRGNTSLPLTEEIEPDPISVYGSTKLEGEIVAMSTNPRTLVLRTAWLYSSFGNNFVKTMIRLGKERDELGVIADQIGTPTYAGDLAKTIIEIVKFAQENGLDENRGVFHYSNEGVASWYDFAKAIFDLKSIDINLKPLKTTEYVTSAKRPQYSLMDKSRIKSTFNLQIPYWRDSLKNCLELLED